MTSDTNQWGLSTTPRPARRPRAKDGGLTGLPPQQARAAHKGIVWIHLSAVAVWLFVALLLGAFAAAGKNVPAALILAGVAAAAGHGLFVLAHLYFAAKAARRAAAR